ncbi:competence type IV pilus major pilin ComGC [Companilactobacillus nuruki]|uniref:Competence protein ComGC n=1 Tax=Companilactobacillus nuruki TaxID=1993540 RepID=A0A2N7ATV4_9LACO|nr:competence type IV pilus major pilin ComGC [Companilactobacillus nuruki]PMD70219.1 competence protein ComGC [Companilactobacillus nuruki]
MKKRKAFTLIEMVIVLFIISLLLLIMIPNLAIQKDHADKKSQEAFKTTLVTQAGLYDENNGDGKTITIDVLKREKYITEAQYKRAEKLKINKDTDLLVLLNDSK